MKANLQTICQKVRASTGTRHSIICWICGLAIVAFSVSSALADTEYTYEFTANPGQVTWYNGTTFEVEVVPGLPGNVPPPDLFFNIVSLDFHSVLDHLPAWAGDPPYFAPTPASLTPFSFSPSGWALSEDFVGIGEANAFGWTGGFNGYGGFVDFFSGSYLITSSEVFWAPDAGGVGEPIVTEAALGTWTLVPDGGSSFELLAMATAALGAGRFFLRTPK